MALFRRIVFVAALAGLLAGLFVTALHQVGTVPVILKAEVYEQAAAPHDHGDAAPAAHDHGAAAHDHDHDATAWEPADGLERSGYTVLADILTGIGFALLLVCAYALTGSLTGRTTGWRQGLLWGLAGFAVFTLAPGLGLRPEIPGTEAAPLADRQLWWVATALATAGGLALLVFGRRALLAVLGIALLVAPHVIGAPLPAEFHSAAPEALAHRFAETAFATSLLFWAALGALSGYFYQRFG
jgi:cobalt transporter subunit CbtA